MTSSGLGSATAAAVEAALSSAAVSSATFASKSFISESKIGEAADVSENKSVFYAMMWINRHDKTAEHENASYLGLLRWLW